MAEILLFHHSLGLTPAVRDFAETLRQAGHTVHLPDLYDGRVFDTIDDGMGYAREVGFGKLFERGEAAAQGLPDELVYAGFSLGVGPAQSLAQTRPGAKGAQLIYSCFPVSEFSEAWPVGVPVQIHGMDQDPFFTEEGGDLDSARALVESTSDAELFVYPGDQHLFAEKGTPFYDEPAAMLMTERVLAFLDRVK
jgi:dienelactone hydrolase